MGMPMRRADRVSTSSNPPANTAVEAVIVNQSGGRTYIMGANVFFGYDATPTGGALVFLSGSTEIARIPVTSAGAGQIDISGLNSALGENLTARLLAGGTGVRGYVTLMGWDS